MADTPMRQGGESTKADKWKDTRSERPERMCESDAYAVSLEKLAIEQARRREPVSTRMLMDVQQFKGVYTETIRRELERNPGASKLFVNITRPKCKILHARLMEILYPTDDSNWAATPTPDPELEVMDRNRQELAAEIDAEAAEQEALALPAPVDPMAGQQGLVAAAGAPPGAPPGAAARP